MLNIHTLQCTCVLHCMIPVWNIVCFTFVTDCYRILCFMLITTDLSQRVDAVKDENLKLKSENQVRSMCCFCREVGRGYYF